MDQKIDFRPPLLTFLLLIAVQLLIFKIKVGLIVIIAISLLIVALLKPKFIYLLLISLFSIEGFSVLEKISYPKIIGILLMIGLTMKILLKKEALPKDDTYKYFFMFFAGSIGSFIFSKDLSVTLSIYITYISLFIIYICTRYFLKDIRDIEIALKYLFLSTLFIFFFLQIIFNINSEKTMRVSSGMGDPNEFASYILVLIPLTLYMAINNIGFRKLLYYGILICFLFLLILTISRGGILGFIGAATVLIFYYSRSQLKQILLFILIVLAIAYLCIPDELWFRLSTVTNPELEFITGESSIHTRLENYQAAVKMFLDYPLAGVGLYNFRFYSKDYGTSGGLVVHNTYLEMLTGGGLLSFVPFALILLACWKKLKVRNEYNERIRNLKICMKASFISLLISSFFISGDHKKILWFSLALISSTYYISKRKDLIQKNI